MTVAELLADLERRAAEAERLGATAPVEKVLRTVAADLSQALARGADDRLGLREAARESGYSEPHLRRLVAAGRLQASPEPGPMRFRRGDLPRKPGYRPPALVRSTTTP